jgi:copper chaperone CopZ
MSMFSLVTHLVTVRHTESITPPVIAHALEKVGFDVEVEGNGYKLQTSWSLNPVAARKRKRRHIEVCKSCQAEERAKREKKTLIPRPSLSKSVNTIKSAYTEKAPWPQSPHQPGASLDVRTELSISGMSCATCANAITEALKENRNRGILSCDVNLMSNSAVVVHDSWRFSADDVAQLIVQLGYTAEVVNSSPVGRKRVASQDHDVQYRLEFHIGGMTCASCSNSITHGLQEEPYIKSVNVNLMANSGTVIIEKKEDANKVKEAVEAMGFICDLGEIAPLRPLEPAVNDIRLVAIKSVICYAGTHPFTYTS